MNRSNVGASSDTTHFLMDAGLMIFSFGIIALAFHSNITQQELITFLILSCVQGMIFLLANKQERVYNVTLFYYTDRIFRKITKSFLYATCATGLVVFYIVPDSMNRRIFVCYWIVSYVLLCSNSLVFHRMLDKWKNRKNVPRTAFVGKKDAFNKFQYFLEKTSIRINPVGYIYMDDTDTAYDKSNDYIGALSDLEKLIREHKIDQIYILQKRENELSYIQQYIDLCIEMGVTCRVVVDVYKRRRANSYVSTVGTYPVITYHTICLNTFESLLKRCVDIVGALVGIILSSPIMIATAIAIKLDSPGPVLFKQTRVGQNGRLFKCFKFRSMYIDAEVRKAELMAQNEMDGLMFKMKDDPRVTKVGKFIRKCSIDELPQFFNVLFGTMSLVGTRPPTVDEVEQYERGQWRRISIKPGITGMWQVSGRSNITSFDEVVELDVDYIDSWSIWMDFRIMFKTVAVLFEHEGAY